ncbi:MAG: PfkB family carbohydrate kinase [Bacteroidia bacterium]|nr:PfkB family carbohydrate kinase [Bacteroidia bacterium]MDW8234989.1 PfkB family carbohydrate kinase [Bacteroidia bacterium]
MRLVIAGTMALDTVETPFGKAERIVGGAATYIALAASFYTKGIGIVSIVGNDFPASMLADLEQRGIDLTGVVRHLSRPSFFWAGRYHADMQGRDTLETQLNVLLEFPDALPPAYRQAEMLLLGNLDPELQMRIYQQINPRPRFVAMDTMNFWITGKREALERMIAQVDMLSINDEEARQLAGDYSLRRCARAILGMGPRYLLIKKGENGALLFLKNGEIFFFPAYPLEDVFDPTGAGDTFAGAIMGYLSLQEEITLEALQEAIIQGTILASFCVEQFGVQALLTLSEKEVEARKEQLLRMSHFIRLPARA